MNSALFRIPSAYLSMFSYSYFIVSICEGKRRLFDFSLDMPNCWSIVSWSTMGATTPELPFPFIPDERIMSAPDDAPVSRIPLKSSSTSNSTFCFLVFIRNSSAGVIGTSLNSFNKRAPRLIRLITNLLFSWALSLSLSSWSKVRLTVLSTWTSCSRGWPF